MLEYLVRKRILLYYILHPRVYHEALYLQLDTELGVGLAKPLEDASNLLPKYVPELASFVRKPG